MAQTQHDHLFWAVFSRPTEAASFLQAHLPPALAAAIRWNLLTCIKSGFEDAAGTAPEADLVFSTRLQINDTESADIEIAILFEHQSTPDDRMPLRLLGYMLRTFEAQLAERGRRRPVPVIPVVLYDGQRPSTAPTQPPPCRATGLPAIKDPANRAKARASRLVCNGRTSKWTDRPDSRQVAGPGGISCPRDTGPVQWTSNYRLRHA